MRQQSINTYPMYVRSLYPRFIERRIWLHMLSNDIRYGYLNTTNNRTSHVSTARRLSYLRIPSFTRLLPLMMFDDVCSCAFVLQWLAIALAIGLRAGSNRIVPVLHGGLFAFLSTR
ncbi:Transcriptional antiactivator ExsD [Dirofilaria immitis]